MSEAQAEPPVSTLGGLAGGQAPTGAVALTFDDGPSEPYTSQVLDLLEAHGERATFFVLGENAARRPALVRRMDDMGCTVAVHAWTHERLPERSPEEVRTHLRSTADVIGGITGTAPRFARPPYGATSPAVDEAMADCGLTPVYWSAFAWDWTRPGADVIVEQVLDGLHDGAVVLLHDGGGERDQTVAALPAILAAMRWRGLRSIALHEL